MLFTLLSITGISVSITEYGATITTLTVPDSAGSAEDVVLGFDSLEPYLHADYLKTDPNFGAVVGRYANRIRNGRFVIKGTEHQLACNEGSNILHGGFSGFSHKHWKAQCFETDAGISVVLKYESPDGEEGFPGIIKVTIEYLLENENSLKVNCSAVCDRDTIDNLYNHSYFNLAGVGRGNGSIKSHELSIYSSKCIELEEGFLPTGVILDVDDPDLDFRSSSLMREIMEKDENHTEVGWFAQTWIVDGEENELKKMSTLYDPSSGRLLDIYSDAPGSLLYTGDDLDGSLIGKNNCIYDSCAGLCLEPQQLHDAPNNENFTSAVLKKGEEYKTTTVYKFSTVSRCD